MKANPIYDWFESSIPWFIPQNMQTAQWKQMTSKSKLL